MASRLLIAAAAILMATSGVASAGGKSVRGVVQTGGTTSSVPLANVNVTLFEATSSQPTALGQAATDASGRFTIPYRKGSSSSIFYLAADIGGGVEFVSVLGPNLPASATINELTTVAASYSMAQFYRTGVISGNSFGLQIAAEMNDNIVVSATGDSSPVLSSSPNADQTASLRSTRSLANLLAACVGDPDVTASLFGLTISREGSAPRNTAQALANLARDPGQHVDAIYALTLLSHLYGPTLTAIPDAWTVTVKVNDSGSDDPDLLFGGPGNLAFDQRGYAWVTNNVVQGTPYSTRSVIVLKPNGQPADGKKGTPASPLTRGGLLGTGFGVTIDPRGFAWFGNFGWGDCTGCDPSPEGNGSISRFTSSGAAVSQPNGYQGGPVRAQGLAADADGNIWISSFGNDSVYVFINGNPHKSVGFQQDVGSGPFDVALAPDGTAWVSNGLGKPPSSVAKYALVDGTLKQQFRHFLGQGLRGLSVDSRGNAWVASQGDSMVYAVRPDGTQIGPFNGGGIDGPWDTAIDGEENVWVANFGPLELGNTFTGRLTKLCGDAHHCPRGMNVGDPISPATGYTVPSAGSEVLLHNGDPLYGPGRPPSFIPMMRQTGVVIDQAGNIWSINNWKPNFDNDAIANPGGDGIIIFVGLAPPPRGH
jgi:streptogramin lyase